MIAIIVVGYNRPDSISILLDSLSNGDYENDFVDLIVSIDKGENQLDVISVAEKFEWEFGEKKIRAYDERQGLRKHILACGDLTNVYDAVIVLEDDLIVSKSFYRYIKNAIQFYSDDSIIAGISLYSYPANEFCDKPFTPLYNGYDTFLMQVAQSWGQCWTRKMWQEFRNWEFADAERLPNNIAIMPQRIYHWGKTSWKKNYMAYIASKDKYFVYPYHSYSTNRSEIGTHRIKATTDYQVPLVENMNNWRFAPVESAIKYDIYFERIGLSIKHEDYNDQKVCMDIYGLKECYQDATILFSIKKLPYKLIQEVGLCYRPPEVNCSLMVSGKGIFMYDLTKNDHISIETSLKENEFIFYEYNTIAPNWHFSLHYAWFGFVRAVCRKVWRNK